MYLIKRGILLIFLINESYGVIYYLNESEYARMPPIYKLDNYNRCLEKSGDAYCSVSFNLVSDRPSDLLQMIEEYSEQTATHYNHTKIRYGVCVTQSCQHYIPDKKAVSESKLEECLNHTFWEHYKLKAKVQHFECYSLSDKNINIDVGDVITGIIIFVIMMLNVIGTSYDYCYTPRKHKVKSIILVFSIKQNWKRLISADRSFDYRIQRLKGINGLRFIFIYGVILVHCFWPYLIALENSYHLELSYYSLANHILFNGSIMIQSYLVISGLLLAYKLELFSEKRKLDWRIVPRGLLLRYLRLTPAYAVVIALSATWLKFIGPGPLWEVSAEPSLLDCRKRWWLNLLYLNNYVYNSQCMVPGWYLATDMQLYCLGLIVCVLLRHRRMRKTLLLVLFMLGIILPAVHTYIRDFNPHMLISPGEARSLFATEPTFNETYKTGHGNIASYVLGIALGYLIYSLQQIEVDIRKYKKLKFLYWTVLPLIICVILSGAVFYRDAPRDPLYIRVSYAAFAKPILGTLIAVLIAGMVFRLENVYRAVLESSLWTVPGKLSYSVYIVHFPLLRIYLAFQTSLLYLTTYNLIAMSVCITIVSYIAAMPLFLLVEAPFTELTKHIKPEQKVKEDVPNGYHEYEKDTSL